MKIGIILCGDVPTNLLEEFGSYSDCLQKALALNLHERPLEWNMYQKHQLPDTVDRCDAYIIGGSPFGVNDGLEWIDELAWFVRDAFHARKRLIGICFGHQLINHALGGKVEKSARGWGLGAYDVFFKQDLGEMKVGQTMALLAIHQDQVIKPAKNFDIVAGSDFCPYYITKYQNQVLTVQGHPEFNYSFFEALLNQRKDSLSEDEIKQALIDNNSQEHRSICNKFLNKFIFSPNT
ncbi:type 1 glutamine amidotransferase [Cohaesibacter celericrescens]|uniref:type 1 glutamine amidotransferase n=1 Tax=Cohaesibacter celericrescens TaxID=2067669 RepID=UPI003563B87A